MAPHSSAYQDRSIELLQDEEAIERQQQSRTQADNPH
jgi:hypothetical protein